VFVTVAAIQMDSHSWVESKGGGGRQNCRATDQVKVRPKLEKTPLGIMIRGLPVGTCKFITNESVMHVQDERACTWLEVFDVGAS
jgi:hypothetical protein